MTSLSGLKSSITIFGPHCAGTKPVQLSGLHCFFLAYKTSWTLCQLISWWPPDDYSPIQKTFACLNNTAFYVYSLRFQRVSGGLHWRIQNYCSGDSYPPNLMDATKIPDQGGFSALIVRDILNSTPALVEASECRQSLRFFVPTFDIELPKAKRNGPLWLFSDCPMITLALHTGKSQKFWYPLRLIRHLGWQFFEPRLPWIFLVHWLEAQVIWLCSEKK